MPSIKPFKGIIYNKDKVKNIAKVVAPPYDIISPKMQDSLYRKHVNNIVRLILGKINKADREDDNRYTRAARSLHSWLNDGVLIRDEESTIYIYSQLYKYRNRTIERVGFISLMQLETEDKKVLPHENTLKAPKEDRLQLMRSVKANLSPIFMLYEDDKRAVNRILKSFCMKTKPFINIVIDGVRHKVWKLTDRDAIGKIEGAMSEKEIFIADGHHRYETSKNYARKVEASDAPKELKDNSKFFMAYFVALEEKTLTILPTHRLIKDIGRLNKKEIISRVEKYFAVGRLPSAKRMLARLSELKAHHAFGMYLGRNEFYIIRLKKENSYQAFMGANSKDWKNLDVAVLHLFIIQNLLGISDEDDNIEFVKDAYRVFRLVDRGGYKMAFFLNPTKVSQMKKVARRGEKMPRKATYFYPKPLSGLVINSFRK